MVCEKYHLKSIDFTRNIFQYFRNLFFFEYNAICYMPLFYLLLQQILSICVAIHRLLGIIFITGIEYFD